MIDPHPNGSGATLNRAITERISRGSLSLDELQAATGIHRAKLGRMRSGDCDVTPAEAALICRALTASQTK